MKHLQHLIQKILNDALSYFVWKLYVVVERVLHLTPLLAQFKVAGFESHSSYADISTHIADAADHARVQDVNAHRPLRVMMIGLRGFPDVQGGVEAHAQNLAPLLTKMGCEVEVVVRSPYQSKTIGRNWSGVNFTRIWSPKSKGLEAILHTFLGVLYAGIKRPDVLHIHAIGPALMTPLARLLGLKVVVTHHGPDYQRQKWGVFARNILKLGEWCGMSFSNGRIVISQVIRQLVLDKHQAKSDLIYNGVNIPKLEANESLLDQFGIKKGRYILMVTRLVPEKRHIDVIQAFAQANIGDCKLVIVGKSDHPDVYVQELLHLAATQPNVVMTGYQTGENLHALFAYAGLFVLPSSHEGLSISLLEALSYGIPVVASDIPANLEVGMAETCYFPVGNVPALANRLTVHLNNPLSPEAKSQTRAWVGNLYSWDRIAQNTYFSYLKVLRSI